MELVEMGQGILSQLKLWKRVYSSWFFVLPVSIPLKHPLFIKKLSIVISGGTMKPIFLWNVWYKKDYTKKWALKKTEITCLCNCWF